MSKRSSSAKQERKPKAPTHISRDDLQRYQFSVNQWVQAQQAFKAAEVAWRQEQAFLLDKYNLGESADVDVLTGAITTTPASKQSAPHDNPPSNRAELDAPERRNGKAALEAIK
jgi:hypothetical protein